MCFVCYQIDRIFNMIRYSYLVPWIKYIERSVYIMIYNDNGLLVLPVSHLILPKGRISTNCHIDSLPIHVMQGERSEFALFQWQYLALITDTYQGIWYLPPTLTLSPPQASNLKEIITSPYNVSILVGTEDYYDYLSIVSANTHRRSFAQ